jgi:hypothetical protein
VLPREAHMDPRTIVTQPLLLARRFDSGGVRLIG